LKKFAVLVAGEDKITVTWGVNQTLAAGTDSAYKTIKVKLCYAPISQVDRAWRKTVDNMAKDKTCQFQIVAKPYDASNKTVQSFELTVERDVPSATYFVRAYAYNSEDVLVAYGQTTNTRPPTCSRSSQSLDATCHSILPRFASAVSRFCPWLGSLSLRREGQNGLNRIEREIKQTTVVSTV